MTEKKMWQLMRVPFNRMKHKRHTVRIESHDTSIGIPDVHYTVGGTSGWIELKRTSNNATPEIRPAQVRWITAECMAGGKVWVLAHMDKTNKKPAVWLLINGTRIRELALAKDMEVWLDLSDSVYFGDINWEVLMERIT